MERHHGQDNSYIKETFNWGLDYPFRRLVHHHRGGEHGGMQAGARAEAESYIVTLRVRDSDAHPQ